MRFWNSSKGFRLVVQPRHKRFDPISGTAERTQGLSVEFQPTGQYGVFDSEVAARNKGWSPEQRKTVERALLEHVTFGSSMHLLDLPDEEAKVLGIARTCMFIRPAASGEIAYCGREIEGDAPYCERCTTLLSRAEEMAKNEVELVDEPEPAERDVTDHDAAEVPEMPPMPAGVY
jgi:hypothetical protein